MLVTGMRLGEALGILWDNVDVDKGTVFIRQALQRVTLEDGTTELHMVEPKSDT